MNGSVKKIIYSTTVALALGSTPAFAVSCRDNSPPCPFEQGSCASDLGCAYNAPARPEVRGCMDVFLTASALYWHVDGTAMEIATRNSEIPIGAVNPIQKQPLISPKFRYHPGFKVGLGVRTNHDSWVVSADYTRLHQASNKISKAILAGVPGTLTPTNFFTMDGADQLALSSLHSRWRTNLDMLDLQVSRSFYQGYCLTVNPFAGIRGTLLRQGLNLKGDDQLETYTSYTGSRAWAIGPTMGVESNFIIGAGFRVTSELSGSLLYTKYKVSHKMGLDPADVRIAPSANGTLSPIAQFALGLGWGKYLNRQNYFMDIVAKYEFMNFFQANYCRSFVNTMTARIGTEPASLHFHGPTLSATLHF